jgi:hypothetical protein
LYVGVPGLQGTDGLLLSLCDSRGGRNRSRDSIVLPLSSDLLLVDGDVGGVAQHGWQDSGGGRWQTLGLGQR